MQKNDNISFSGKLMFVKYLLLMKFTLFLILFFSFQSIALDGNSQKISISVKNLSVEQALKSIEAESGFRFVYSRDILPSSAKVNIHAVNADLHDVLQTVLKNTSLEYKRLDKNLVVIISRMSVSIQGTVADTEGIPIPNVSIIEKGTSNGTITDAEGRFSLNVNNEMSTIVISHVEYTPQEIVVGSNKNLKIVLQLKERDMNEIVIVGYGQQKKVSLVGAQATVKPAELQLPVRSLSNSLGGRIAGVVSVQRSGEPGGDNADIWIRGISTFSSGLSKPLVLVDGVPRPFSDVDPEDIENFTILKDASATAVYGVRGANGVILINTKNGRAGKPKFDLRYNEAITTFTKIPDFIDGVTYMELSNEALTNRGAQPRYPQEAIEATRNQTDPYLYPNVDWYKELFNKYGSNRRLNLNINGGSDYAQYYVAVSYFDEKGLYKTDALANYDSQVRYKRYNLTSNLTVKPSSSTTIRLGVQGYLANVNYPGSNSSDIFEKAFFMTPILIPKQYENGEIADVATSGVWNPYALLTQTGYANQWRNQLFSNLRVTQGLDFITKGLSATAMLSFDAYNYVSLRRTKTPDTWLANGRDENGKLILQQTLIGTEYLSYSRNNTGSRTIYNEAALNYNRSFGQHDIGAMLLYNQSDEINTLAGDLETSLPYRFRGLAGRSTYAFNNTYFLEANFGYNGSENFLPSKRYGFFPSVGLGWLVSNENFFQKIKPVVQMLKFRFSHGEVGNSNIGGRRFAYLGTVASTTGYTFGKNSDKAYSGYDIGEYAVDVTWETSIKTNIGMDISTLDNALSAQIDFFNEHREGIFLRRSSLPAYVGMRNNPYGNVGIIDNQGIDGSVTYTKRINKDFNFQIIGNFTFNRNKVIEDDSPEPAYPWLAKKGRKVGQRFGYVALGFFESQEEIANSPLQSGDIRPGDLKFKDLNGDGVINSYDQAPIGYGPVPEIVYGLGLNLGYKAFSFSALLQGVGNMDIWLNGEGLVPFQQGLSRGNMFENATDRWRVDNPNPHAFYPRLGAGTINDNYTRSTWWIQSGRYLRLKSLQLLYKLPKDFVSKARMTNADIFFAGTNLLTFTPFKLWDAELGDGDNSYPGGAKYPNIATYSIGINLNF